MAPLAGRHNCMQRMHESSATLRRTPSHACMQVTLDFTRKVPPPPESTAAARAAEVVIQLGNVEVPTKRAPQQLAEMIVRRGFAAVQVRRSLARTHAAHALRRPWGPGV
jgi:hypothetical protein